jgi:hypothetical protein
MKYMNSDFLKENGFPEASPLKTISASNLPSNKGSVLILINATAKSPSDILYIGKTKKPTKRIFGGYLAGYGGKATRKINAKLFDEGYIEKVAVSWIAADDPKAKQQDLLEKFHKAHGQYPEWNTPAKKNANQNQQTSAGIQTCKTRSPRKAAA